MPQSSGTAIGCGCGTGCGSHYTFIKPEKRVERVPHNWQKANGVGDGDGRARATRQLFGQCGKRFFVLFRTSIPAAAAVSA